MSFEVVTKGTLRAIIHDGFCLESIQASHFFFYS
jgi:hypothetical protein